MKFKVYRDSWLRGEGEGVLHRSRDNKECCLGQMCAQLGAPVVWLAGNLYPSSIRYQHVICGDLLKFVNEVEDLQGRLGMINDGDNVWGNREEQIQAQMKTIGYEVEFVEGKAPWIDEV